MIEMLPGTKSTVSALHAERVRLDIIGQNIANANTTRGLDGKPYQRLQVSFETALGQAGSLLEPESMGGPEIASIKPDTRPGQLVHNPEHPHANAEGMVQLPNVNIHEEMADMIAASRTFEANLAVFKNSRQLAMQTLAMGRK